MKKKVIKLIREREVTAERPLIRGLELMRDILCTKVIEEEVLGNSIVEKESPPEKSMQGIKMFAYMYKMCTFY